MAASRHPRTPVGVGESASSGSKVVLSASATIKAERAGRKLANQHIAWAEKMIAWIAELEGPSIFEQLEQELGISV